MISPDKYIRKAYGQLLSGIGCPIYDMVLPKDVIPIPQIYVLVSTQTKRPYETTKCGHEWDTTILLDIIGVFENGYARRDLVDDVESAILSAIDTWTFEQTDIEIPPFRVYNTKVDDSHDDYLVTDTKTIVRKLLRFRHYINSVNFVVS